MRLKPTDTKCYSNLSMGDDLVKNEAWKHVFLQAIVSDINK